MVEQGRPDEHLEGTVLDSSSFVGETTRPADIAERALIHASLFYTASRTAQGASIALYLRENGGIEPVTGLQALLDSPAHVDKVAVIGTKAHEARKRGTVPLPPDHVRFVAVTSFTYAQGMTYLDDERLQEVLRLFGVAYKTGPKVMVPEGRLKMLVNDELRSSGIVEIGFRQMDQLVTEAIERHGLNVPGRLPFGSSLTVTMF